MTIEKNFGTEKTKIKIAYKKYCLYYYNWIEQAFSFMKLL